MSELNPITREEMYLAAAAGQEVPVPEPITRTEMFLANLANNASMFVPVTQEEYDALVASGTVDGSKYYLIVGDSE